MKILLVLLIGLFSYSANALTVCAGSSVHYVLDQKSYGIQPTDGMLRYSELISIRGKVLGERAAYIGKPAPDWGIQVSTKNVVVLHQSGTMESGSSIASAVMHVKKNGVLVVRDNVTCTNSWMIVP